MQKNDCFKEKLSVIIPCYNEAANLPIVLPEIIRYCEIMNWNLIIVNDGSKDESKGLLSKFSSNCLSIIHHKLNKGYGAAIKTGIQNVDTEWVITIDSDGQHNPEDINKLLTKAEETDADMVVGSRRKQGSISLYRGIGKYFIRKFANFFIPNTIEDINSGMKLYRRDLAMRYISLCPDSMAFSDIILFFFVYNRNLVLEEDITIKQRIGGKSTISTTTAIDTMVEIVNIILLFSPMKLFFPISIVFFLLGLIWATRTYFVSHQLSTGSEFMMILSIIIFFMGVMTDQLTRIRRKF